MGGSGSVCVTTCVCGVAVRITRFVVTTRRTRFTGRLAAWRLRTTFFLQQVWTCAVAGPSAIFIAPLPMIAPPQVQAQSLAKLGRAACRVRVCTYESITVVPVELNNKNTKQRKQH